MRQAVALLTRSLGQREAKRLNTFTVPEGATGRPEEVVDALGHSAAEARFHRRQLFFSMDGTD